MEAKEFKKLKVGDLLLWHNTMSENEEYWCDQMQLAIVTSEPIGTTLIGYRKDDEVVYFSNVNQEFDLIEKGAFKPLPTNIHPTYVRSFFEVDGIEYD